MGEVKDVVEAVSVRVLDVVGQSVAEVNVVAPEDDRPLGSARTLSELNLKPPRKLLLLRKGVIE